MAKQPSPRTTVTSAPAAAPPAGGGTVPEGATVFDRRLLRRRRDRAAPGFDDYDFLKSYVVEQTADRLRDFTRTFSLALDLGGHNGCFARQAADQIETVVTADLSEAMAARAPRPAVVADEERLPFREGVFDLAVSLLSLQSVNDLPGALIQARRSLKPDGLFIAAILGGETLTELRQSLMAAELETTEGAAPRVSPFTDVRDAGSLLQRAGFALPVTDREKLTVRYKTPFKLLEDLRGMGESNTLRERQPGGLRRDTLMRMAEIYQEKFALADGRVPATFEIVTLTGWSPHESQQKPLRPGSAKMRLADALKTEEKSTGVKPGES
jgi:SAM-dependent methyltransferase